MPSSLPTLPLRGKPQQMGLTRRPGRVMMGSMTSRHSPPHTAALTMACLLVAMMWPGPSRLHAAATSVPVLEGSARIWDEAPHNAFTDLIRFHGEWLCVFREGQAHVSPDGALRVIASGDGKSWRSKARLTHPKADLRDAKISLGPDGRLFLTGAAAWHPPNPARHLTLAWRSMNGTDWGEPFSIGETNQWLWRVTTHRKEMWGVGYATEGDKITRLYRSRNGKDFQTWIPAFFKEGYPNETALRFLPDDTMVCLLRRDQPPHTGQLGRSRPPYKEWEWKDLKQRIGGPNFLILPDQRAYAVVRLYDDKVRTSLCRLDVENGTLKEALVLPSGGDTSYAGMVWHEERLWISYYSSHEGKTAIYLAVVRL